MAAQASIRVSVLHNVKTGVYFIEIDGAPLET
jgi:hypothetical protein